MLIWDLCFIEGVIGLWFIVLWGRVIDLKLVLIEKGKKYILLCNNNFLNLFYFIFLYGNKL